MQALITLFANITFFRCPKPIPPSSSLHRCILHHIFLTPCQSTFNHPHDYLNLKRRHNNTFSHHPAPAQCTPSLPCNLFVITCKAYYSVQFCIKYQPSANSINQIKLTHYQERVSSILISFSCFFFPRFPARARSCTSKRCSLSVNQTLDGHNSKWVKLSIIGEGEGGVRHRFSKG